MSFYIQVHKEPAHVVTDIKVLIHVRQGNHQSSGKWTLCLWRIRKCRHRQREEGNDAHTYWHWGYILFIAKWSFQGYHSLHVMKNKLGPPLTLLLSQFKDDDSFVLVQSCQKGGYLFQYQLHLWCFNPNFSVFHSRLFSSMCVVR